MSLRSVLTGGDPRAAASSSSASHSKRWRSSLSPWIGFFTRSQGENETTICWGYLSEAGYRFRRNFFSGKPSQSLHELFRGRSRLEGANPRRVGGFFRAAAAVCL